MRVPIIPSENASPARTKGALQSLLSLGEVRPPSASLGTTAFDLLHEDCVRGMAKLPAASIDLVVTSPPYNLGIRYSEFSDRADRTGYLRWCQPWAAVITRLLKPDDSYFLNVAPPPANLMFPHVLVQVLRHLFV